MYPRLHSQTPEEVHTPLPLQTRGVVAAAADALPARTGAIPEGQVTAPHATPEYDSKHEQVPVALSHLP